MHTAVISKKKILQASKVLIQQDAHIRSDVFTTEFMPEDLANILFSLMLSALIGKDYEPAVVLQLLQKLLY